MAFYVKRITYGGSTFGCGVTSHFSGKQIAAPGHSLEQLLIAII
jgi:hypothetical protein